jgi:NAD(P)-dependent dehydrogenase (short-subunit alcohol dehydrogenase family)
MGRLDCLFNNAGGPAPVGGIVTIPVDGFDAAMATLVRSVMLGEACCAVMMRQGSGSIINNGSVAGRLAGYSTSMIYGAAKAAVNHLTVCSAMQLGEKNVRCNSISPGGIATGIFAKALGLAPDKADAFTETMKAFMAKHQPTPRAGMTDDIAHAAVFLASDESGFINGHDLVVDGGLVGGRMWTPHQEGVKAMRQAFGVDEL